jgi:16S rRNA (uracil1498-N3)-methyltransferase
VAVTVEGNQAHYLARVMRLGEAIIVILCDDSPGSGRRE